MRNAVGLGPAQGPRLRPRRYPAVGASPGIPRPLWDGAGEGATPRRRQQVLPAPAVVGAEEALPVALQLSRPAFSAKYR